MLFSFSHIRMLRITLFLSYGMKINFGGKI
jgi:hypothetical protein